MRGKILLAGVATLVSLAIALLAAEFAVRYRERTRDTAPGSLFIYYPHERLRQAFIRSTQYYRWVRINAQGFRGRDVGPKNAETTRIIVVGESTTFDQSVAADSLTWPARLEHALNTQHGCRVEVINAGVPGYRILDNLIRLHTELVQYQPDLIVLYHPHNDLFRAIRNPASGGDPRRPGEADYPSSLSRWLTRNSILFGKLKSRSGLMRGRSLAARSGPPTRERLDRLIRVYVDELSTFLAIARFRNIPVELIEAVHVSGAGTKTEPDTAIRGLWKASFPLMSAEQVLEAYGLFHDAARATAAANGAGMIPSEDFGIRGTEWFGTGDPIHFNEQGAERMGQRVAAKLATGALARPRCGKVTGVESGPRRDATKP